MTEQSAISPGGAKVLMVVGTTSGAGKSWLVTALCRWYARQGLKVAPFKAQNMSNNARVVAGGEIGSAQYFQALAAGVEPTVDMNPVLLKPERDTRSQVVVRGQVRPDLGQTPWHERAQLLWPIITESLAELASEVDLIVIEGAGSPAEINLMPTDLVNLRVAQYAHEQWGQADAILVSDIDKGGAFAHLYGTHALLPPEQQSLIRGFVLNKFRGDAALLEPAPSQLQELTGVPTIGVIPMVREHGLPEEDGVFDERWEPQQDVGGSAPQRRIAIIAYPHLSNLDEFQPLRGLPGVQVVWARTAATLRGLDRDDWIILPGSKTTTADLRWLHETGLDAAVVKHASNGGAVLGICGGLQMLGEGLHDPHAADGEVAESVPGLGLLGVETTFEHAKATRRSEAEFVSGSVWPEGPWGALAGVAVAGYEIRQGSTVAVQGANGQPLASETWAEHAIPVLPDGLGWINASGNVLGLYLHGLMEDPRVLNALFGVQARGLDEVFESLADLVHQHLDLTGILE